MTRGLLQWNIVRTTRSIIGFPCNPGACIRTGQWDDPLCVCGRTLTVWDILGRGE